MIDGALYGARQGGRSWLKKRSPARRDVDRRKMVTIMLVLGALLTAADIVWTFTLAPLVQGAALEEPAVIAGRVVTTKLLLSQKISICMFPSRWPRSQPCSSPRSGPFASS